IGDAGAGYVAATLNYGLQVGRGGFPAALDCTPCSDDEPCAVGEWELGLCTVPIPLVSEARGRQACSDTNPCPGGLSCHSEKEETFLILNVRKDTNTTTSEDDRRVMPHPEGCVTQPCYCALPPQGAWKFSTAHEVGHVVEDLLTGGLNSPEYRYVCPSATRAECETLGTIGEKREDVFLLEDPPGTEPQCSCSAVETSNGAHCLQSIEATPSAQREGFAHFFAAAAYNDRSVGCSFNYYKEVIGPECLMGTGPCSSTTPQSPPVAVDCGRSYSWRDQNQCGAAATTDAGTPTAPLDMSTEI